MKTQKVLAVALTLMMLLSLVPAGIGLAAPGEVKQVNLAFGGTTTFTPKTPASEEVQNATVDKLYQSMSDKVEREIPRGAANRSLVQTLAVPVVPSNPVTGTNVPGFKGWSGLNHVDSRFANGGNQFSLEPPDQGLCAGSGYVVEAVNDVMTVYSTTGTQVQGVTDLNTFFGYPAMINRTTGEAGPFVTDPKCLYDVWLGHFYLTVLTLDTDTAGNFTGPTHVDIAVSKTNNPTGDWFIYHLDTTNGAGDLPGHPGCPCLGDQPLIGYNQDAFIISTNEFSLFGSEFNGAQIYAIPKLLLVQGKPAWAAYFDNLSLEEGQAYSVQPAFPNSAQAVSLQSKGTEFFLSALEFTGGLDNRIAVWSLTGTQTMYTRSPSLSLNYSVVQSEVYGFPPPADQKVGPYPLGQSLGEPMNMLESNDDRMNQVQFNGLALFSGVNTVVNVGGEERAGIAYFVVAPSVRSGQPVGRMLTQGYVAVAHNNVLFPAIATTLTGKTMMTFTLVGQDYYPSAAYISGLFKGSKVHIAGAGVNPADGFTGYAAYGGNGIERWGDYSAAVTDGLTIWMATEYIPGPRTSLANWGTFIIGVK